MRGGITLSTGLGSSEPARILPYRSSLDDEKPALASQRKSHSRALTGAIGLLRSRRSMAHVIVAIAPFVCHVAVAVAFGVTVHAQTAPRPGGIDRFAGCIAEASVRFAVPVSWIRAVMQVESSGDQRATSSRGAMGLMQLMPGSWAELSARYRLGLDPFDPRDNILAGTAYLKELHDRFGQAGFLAAYHAGPTRYEQHLVTGKPLPPKTTAYVAAVTPLPDNEQREHTAADGRHALPWRQAPLFVERGAHRDGRSVCIRNAARAMPLARALLVASLLTEPPYGCLGPSGSDRYRKRSLCSQTVGRISQIAASIESLLAWKLDAGNERPRRAG